ncbi:MAG: hypothetical protein J6S80_00200 [Alphaproteobacteria bacterium]|nr:hypothetical protein [Alphaproteobacteria bacterium]
MRELYRVFYLVCAFAPCVSWADNFPVAGVAPFPNVPTKASTSSFVLTPGGSGLVAPAVFPGTVADLNMNDKVALRAAGYEPYKDAKSYVDLIVEGEEHYIERQLALLEDEREEDLETMPHEEYCQEYPLDEENCPQIPGLWEEIVSAGEYHPNGSYEQDLDNHAAICTVKTIGGGPVYANHQVISGPCCAPSKTEGLINEVWATKRYVSESPAFVKAMITLFRKEGKCGTPHKDDPCGYTCYGIGQSKKCLGGQLGIDVSKLTPAKAEEIYHDHVWRKYKAYMLPDVISGDVFLAMIGTGPVTVIWQLRDFLKLPRSNVIDETVVNAVKNYQGDIHNMWLNYRWNFLQKVVADRYHGDRRILSAYMKSIRIKRQNGCHVAPHDPLYQDLR